ncbi:MAG TPA: MarR family transcriptional regulator [Gemmatimonadales bacterium]|nr:MarR family transcriptional regulator [Gemmatimonadales bacterium]
MPSRAGTAALADRLHSLAIHLLRRIRTGDAASGLSAPRLSALSVVVFAGPVTVTELARAEGVATPTMTRLLQGLARAGLVERGRDPGDARVVPVRATARGRRVLESARRRRLALLSALLERLAPDEARTVESAVGALEPLLRRSSSQVHGPFIARD